jgi:hypothetical protein
LGIHGGVLKNWGFVISINNGDWHTKGPVFSVGVRVLSLFLFLNSFSGFTEGFTVSFSFCWGFCGSCGFSSLWGNDDWFDSVFTSNLFDSIFTNFNCFLSGGGDSKDMVSHFLGIGKWYWLNVFTFCIFCGCWGFDSDWGTSGINCFTCSGGGFIRLLFFGLKSFGNNGLSWVCWIDWGGSWFTSFGGGGGIRYFTSVSSGGGSGINWGSLWSSSWGSSWGSSWLFRDSDSRGDSEEGNDCESVFHCGKFIL